jgi:hypothetical protein
MAKIGKTKTAQAGKHLGKCPLERSRQQFKYTIKMDLR